MSNDLSKPRTGKLVTYLIGALIGIAVTFGFLLLFAAVIILFGLDRAYSVPFATVSLALGSLAASYYVSKKSERKGYLIGTIIGLISFAVVTVISLIVNKSGLTLNSLFHLIIILLASAIGGVLGVNKGKNKRYI